MMKMVKKIIVLYSCCVALMLGLTGLCFAETSKDDKPLAEQLVGREYEIVEVTPAGCKELNWKNTNEIGDVIKFEYEDETQPWGEVVRSVNGKFKSFAEGSVMKSLVESEWRRGSTYENLYYISLSPMGNGEYWTRGKMVGADTESGGPIVLDPVLIELDGDYLIFNTTGFDIDTFKSYVVKVMVLKRIK